MPKAKAATTLKKESAPRRSGSATGFHYFNLYQCCPRKFYLRFLKRFQNEITAQPLIGGSAFHEGKAAFYLGSPEKACIKIAEGVIEESKKELASPEVYKDLMYRIPNLLHYWIHEHGHSDLKQFKILYVEKEFKIPIKNTTSVFTIRPDAILQDKSSKLIYIMETKTSSFSSRITEEGVVYGDQATAYIYGTIKGPKLEPYGVIPDIAYWNKQSSNLVGMQFIRGEIVTRSPYQIEMFEMGLSQLVTEINQKVLAYKKGFDPRVLFPRNSYYCVSFSTPCEFAQVCGQDCELLKKAPRGFRLDTGIKKITQELKDQIAL